MDFDPKRCVVPALILGLATAGPLPGKKRDDADEPHTHSETRVPMNFYGGAGVMAYTTAGSTSSIWSPRASDTFAHIPRGRMLPD